MAEIAYIILLLAAVIGFAHVIGIIQRKIIFGGKDLHLVSVMPLSGHIEDVELIVRGLISRQRWNHRRTCTTIVLVDAGMDEETREICERISKDRSGVLVCDNCQVGNLIERGMGCNVS